MTLRTILFCALIYVLTLIAFRVNAGRNDITVKTIAPASPAFVVKEVVPLAFTDNADGTVELEVMLCGTRVIITGPLNKIEGPEGDALANELVKRYCGMFL